MQGKSEDGARLNSFFDFKSATFSSVWGFIKGNEYTFKICMCFCVVKRTHNTQGKLNM